VQAALAHRARTGHGQHVDMALYDCMVAAQANQNLNYLSTDHSPKRLGNAHPNIVPYQVFAVADGHVIIACGSDRQFAALALALDHPEWAQDARFSTNPARVAHRDDLTDAITQALSDQSIADAITLLETAGVPVGPIRSIGDALTDPHTDHAGLVIHPEGIPGVRSPFRFSDMELALDRAAPGLGEHAHLFWEDQLT
ncbi:MAG: CaiB/BaiF CoA-transferase family protein, partial [Pseudomonadota bacterium]